MSPAPANCAILYRMVMEKHICPYGLRSKYLLEKAGYTVKDEWLTTREQTEAFKREHDVKTTPQTFIDGKRIGGNEDLRRYLGKPVKDPDAITYKPVIAIFAVAALMALALLGIAGAKAGRAPLLPAMVRVLAWGALAMAITALIGRLAGTIV